jgi:Kae1-associated kinase Bud32
MAQLVGKTIGKVHAADIVHGDLTTSNLMVSPSVDGGLTPRVHLIDFGLGMTRPAIEDKAVDLYVLERALISTHPGTEYLVSPSPFYPA